MVFNRASDRVNSARVARDEAVKDLDTLRAKLVSDMGSEELLTSYRISKDLRKESFTRTLSQNTRKEYHKPHKLFCLSL